MRLSLLPVIVVIILALHEPLVPAQTLARNETIVKYALSVQVRPVEARVEVAGTMRIPAVNEPRRIVQLSLSELMQDLQVKVLSPGASAGAVMLEKMTAEAGSSGPGGTTNRDIIYRVQPEKPFAPGQEIELQFSCSSVQTMGLIFHVGSEVTFASAHGANWYPQINGPSRGIGSLQIAVPAGNTVIASGDKRSSVAEEAQGIFRFENKHPTYFSFIAGKYTVTRREGVIPTSVYLLQSRPNMTEYLEGVQKILKVLADQFGPYQFKEFALVEVPRDLARKAGFNAATPQGFAYINSNAFNVPAAAFSVLLEWYGHEFTHEWWPHVLSFKRPGGRFLEESLAEYGGLRTVEMIAGPAAAEQYRRKGYAPDPIYSALEYFKLVNKGIDAPLGDIPADEKFRDIVYNKGFLVWNMLCHEVGPEKFQSVLRRINRRHAFRKITLKEFWQEIEAGAGRDLGWFYKQWFERTGAPDFDLMWKQDGRIVRGTITQALPYYRATLELEFIGDDGQHFLRNVRVVGARTNFAQPVRFRVRAVILDPHYQVLRWTPEYRQAK